MSATDGQRQLKWLGVFEIGHCLLQTAAHNEAEALREAREAIETIVLTTRKPIELLPRTQDVLDKQAALAVTGYGLVTQTIGKGAQARLRILPANIANGRAGSTADTVVL